MIGDLDHVGVVLHDEDGVALISKLPEDFDRIAAKPRAAPLPDLMQRLDPEALVWLVASVEADNAAVGLAAEAEADESPT